MIGRVWHGWTTVANADAYERLLLEEVFPAIAAKGVPGYRGILLLRRPVEDREVEFLTLMRFDTWEDVRLFAGPDPEKAHVPPQARALLLRFDDRSTHYEARDERVYGS